MLRSAEADFASSLVPATRELSSSSSSSVAAAPYVCQLKFNDHSIDASCDSLDRCFQALDVASRAQSCYQLHERSGVGACGDDEAAFDTLRIRAKSCGDKGASICVQFIHSSFLFFFFFLCYASCMLHDLMHDDDDLCINCDARFA